MDLGAEEHAVRCLLVWARFSHTCTSGQATDGNPITLLATLLFVLALLSKTVTATLPAALFGSFLVAARPPRESWKRDVLPLLPWFALGISAGLFTAWMEQTFVGARGSDFLLTPLQRVLIAGRAICFYAVKDLLAFQVDVFLPPLER